MEKTFVGVLNREHFFWPQECGEISSCDLLNATTQSLTDTRSAVNESMHQIIQMDMPQIIPVKVSRA
jgi:hypothetical protein